VRYSSRKILYYIIKKTEKGRACSMYGEGKRYIQGFGGKT
jgi:hypothetical protein